jgi:hypothetical protein
MADRDDPNKIGYGKPPKHSQFVKGHSGNPKGRPKGSLNLATLLEKIIRQRVTVTENGRSREMPKAEAIFAQLVSKALRGNTHAIHELRYWLQWLEDSTKAAVPPPILSDEDNVVIASIVERIQKSNGLPPNDGTHLAATDSSPDGK